jgi:hypothetical protein
MTKIRVADEIKKLVYANPDREPKSIFVELTERGVKTTEVSVSSYRSDFLGSINILCELGAFAQAAPEKKAKAKRSRQPSRSDRWSDACSRASSGLEDLKALQEEYSEWKDNLPENLQSSPVAEKLEGVCGLDLDSAIDTIGEAEGLDLPMGFGRD